LCSYCAPLRLHHHLPGRHAQFSAEAMMGRHRLANSSA
jgi:hypothetical protein